MSTTMKTPGVYIKELDAFGNSVVPVPTAIPVFIGYTGKTTYNGESLINMPVKVGSLADYLAIFGQEAPKVQFSMTANLLPERVSILTKLEATTTKEKANADAAVAAVTGTASDKLTKAKTAADAADVAAKTALSTAKGDANITALTSAKATIATVAVGDEPTQTQKDNLKNAQNTINTLVSNANFIYKGTAYALAKTTINYRMYSSLKFFYENGGGECYIVSIGGYDFTKPSIDDTEPFGKAITLLEKEMEPTMLVIPDLIEMADTDAYSLQMQMINHCGKMMNRVAILDIPGGYTEAVGEITSVQKFRNAVEPLDPKFNSYAAAYYPWLHTTVYQTSEISAENLKSTGNLFTPLIGLTTDEFTNAKGIVNTGMAGVVTKLIEELNKPASPDKDPNQYDVILKSLSKSYAQLIGAIKQEMNLLAPSAGMAGIYTATDNNQGVWKAPANVGIQSTISPAINIDHETQQDLNKPVNGKSVCAIRAFTGKGILVWGARTLDGNSNDWRYINIRRTLIFIEQSVKDAAKAYVFAPNDANTWVNVQSMISNFLTGIWKQGGLVGPKPADAFSVSVGLGVTMSNDDIQNGIMRVSVKVAVSHPAEFIEITFQQQQQKA